VILIAGTLIAGLRVLRDGRSDLYSAWQQLLQGRRFGADVDGRSRCAARSSDSWLDHVVSVLFSIARRLSVIVVVAALLYLDQIVQVFDHVPRLAVIVRIVQPIPKIPQILLRQLLR